MILRSPIRTLLIFILLVLVSFTFFSQAAEYALTVRELKKTATLYHGTGSIEAAPPSVPIHASTGYPIHLKLDSTSTDLYKLLSGEQVAAVSALKHVTSTDVRYMTAGVSEKYYRLDDGTYCFNFSMRCVVEATVFKEKLSYGYGSVSFYITYPKILAGYIPTIGNMETIANQNPYSATVVYGME